MVKSNFLWVILNSGTFFLIKHPYTAFCQKQNGKYI